MLPKVTRQLTDNNLSRSAAPGAVLNRHVVIIGTAETGPVGVPVRGTTLSAFRNNFGNAQKDYSLMRAIIHNMTAQPSGTANITAIRIASEEAAKASVILDNDVRDALAIESISPGSLYNGITITNTAAAKTLTFSLGNLTDSPVVLTYNWKDPNAKVDAHSVEELASAINAHPVLSRYISASVEFYNGTLEFEVNGDADLIAAKSASATTVDLSQALDGDFIATTRYLDAATPTVDENADIAVSSGINYDGINGESASIAKIHKISKAYSLVPSALKTLEAGKSEFKTGGTLLKLSGRDNAASILNLRTEAGSLFERMASPSDTETVSEAFFTVRNFVVNNTVAADGSATLDITAPWGVDDAELDTSDTIAIAHADALDTKHSLTNEYLGLEDDVTNVRRAGAEALTVEAFIEGEWQTPSGVSATWTEGVLSLSLSGLETGSEEKPGTSFRVSFDSLIGTVTEQASRSTLSADYLNYTVEGGKIVFGAPVPYNLNFRYAQVNYYEPIISSLNSGKLILSGTNRQPGPEGAALGDSDTAIIGFDIEFVPDIPTGTTYVMEGGDAGNFIGRDELDINSLKYEAIETALENLDNIEFDIVVLPGCYIDSKKAVYNSTTGARMEANAGFHTLLKDFLNSYNGEAVAVMGFAPEAEDTIAASTRAERVSRLTEPSTSNPLNAASVLSTFYCKYIIAADAEAFLTADGVSQYETVEAAAAGYMATLDDNEALYLSNVNGIRALKYRYSEDQLEALSDFRIIGMKAEGGGFRFVDGPTLAQPESDFERLTTLWITQRALSVVRQTAKKFLGKGNSIQRRIVMDDTIREALESLVPGYLESFDFSIQTDAASKVIGYIEIPLDLEPQFEIRHIHIPVKLYAD